MNDIAVLGFVSAICGLALALAVACRARRSLVPWSFVAGMAVLGMESLFAALAARSGIPRDIVHWEWLTLVTMSFAPGVWLLFSLSYARGNYREFLIQWRLVLTAAFLAPVLLVLLFPDELVVNIGRTAANQHWVLGLGIPGIVLNLLFLVFAVLVLLNLELTFRASVGTMRWRVKFMVLGIGVLFAVRAYTCSQRLLFHALDLSLQVVNSGALLVACLLILRALVRPGHFDANIYPAPSLVRNSITVLLAGIYLFVVGIFAKVVAFLGGDASFTVKAFLVLVSLVLLTVLILSERARLHAKRLMSRYLQRPLYDYRKVWRDFTEATASHVEQTALCRAIVRLASDQFQVLSVTMWLLDDHQGTLAFGASTSLSDAKAEEARPRPAEAAEVKRALEEHPEPFDIDAAKEPWAAVLRRCQPDTFQKGGNRMCVPMIAGRRMLGLILLGDRVGEVPFSLQDLDLLKCIADQAAASLLNIRLSQRLMQTKELEAFQTMSAFFVHDLKNTASTLSLMLQNLPVHFQNPAFREDALRAISKTVNHINDLISRLSLLRRNLTLKPVETDLNEVVAGALKSLQAASGVELKQEFQPLPKAPVDPEQIQNVVTNLVLNARDALKGHGEIRVQTGTQNGWAILTVSDDGCGIAPEFLRQSLFRPFQTTKKNGTGIGMFQCKMIVEAHRGRIEVESELGKGTSFRILLPLQAIP